MVVRIAGTHLCLWWAAVDEGEVLEFLVRRRRKRVVAGELLLWLRDFRLRFGKYCGLTSFVWQYPLEHSVFIFS
jgi:trehalose utilization protein